MERHGPVGGDGLADLHRLLDQVGLEQQVGPAEHDPQGGGAGGDETLLDVVEQPQGLGQVALERAQVGQVVRGVGCRERQPELVEQLDGLGQRGAGRREAALLAPHAAQVHQGVGPQLGVEVGAAHEGLGQQDGGVDVTRPPQHHRPLRVGAGMGQTAGGLVGGGQGGEGLGVVALEQPHVGRRRLDLDDPVSDAAAGRGGQCPAHVHDGVGHLAELAGRPGQRPLGDGHGLPVPLAGRVGEQRLCGGARRPRVVVGGADRLLGALHQARRARLLVARAG